MASEPENVVHVAMGYPRDVWDLLMTRSAGNPGPLIVSILEGWRSAVEQQDGLAPAALLTGLESPQPGDVGTANATTPEGLALVDLVVDTLTANGPFVEVTADDIPAGAADDEPVAPKSRKR